MVLEYSAEMSSSSAEGWSPFLKPGYRWNRQLVIHAGVIDDQGRREEAITDNAMRTCG